MPKILNAVNVVLAVGKFLGMVDTVMNKPLTSGLPQLLRLSVQTMPSGMIFCLITGIKVSGLALSTSTV